MVEENGPQIMQGESCPSCGKKTLTLMENQMEINAGLIDQIDALECRVDDLEEGWEA